MVHSNKTINKVREQRLLEARIEEEKGGQDGRFGKEGRKLVEFS